MDNSTGGSLEVEYKPEDVLEKELRDFRDEMRTLKTQEEQAIALKAQKVPVLTPWHFGRINPDELELEDRDMWELVKGYMTGATRGNENLLLKLFVDYKDRMRSSEKSSRSDFAAFLANKVGIIFGRSEIEKGKV